MLPSNNKVITMKDLLLAYHGAHGGNSWGRLKMFLNMVHQMLAYMSPAYHI